MKRPLPLLVVVVLVPPALALLAGGERSPAPVAALTRAAPAAPPSRPVRVAAGLAPAPAPVLAEPAPAGAAPGCAHDHAHGPGEIPSPAAQERVRAAARALLGGPVADLLRALDGDDPALRACLARALLDAPAALCDLKLVEGLLGLASDPRGSLEGRLLALELLGRAPGLEAAALPRLIELGRDPSQDPRLGVGAVTALRLLAGRRVDLLPALRPALLAAAGGARDPELRGDALEAVRVEGAPEAEVTCLAAFLGDPSPRVRESAARALGAADVARREEVGQALERALRVEISPQAGAAILAAAVRVGRAEAPALLARLEATALVRATPELARQAADYRALLAAGETDPLRVLREREALETARLLRASRRP